ncbi:MAG: hypothetical protein WA435_14130 [Gallionellaceae bacterium]
MKLRMEPQYLPALFLLSCASLFVLQIGAELRWHQLSGKQPSKSLQSPHNGNEPTLAMKPELVLPPLERTYNQILTRPLFIPSRRPPASPSGSSLPSSMSKGQFTLVGVILTTDKKIAMLHEIATGKVFRVEQGKEINGMQLEKLEPEKVTLKQGDEREELLLKIQPSVKQQLAAAPQPGNPANPGPAGTPAVPGQANIPDGQLSPQQQFLARRRALHRQQNQH